MAGNPRIDDLRRRLEKDPGSRLFAQLAEELRKDGDLEEAINVCREGLKRQPAYPSARMTLGRALFDTGDLAAARAEFETVLKGAPERHARRRVRRVLAQAVARHPDRLPELAVLAQLLGELREQTRVRLLVEPLAQVVDAGVPGQENVPSERRWSQAT